MRAGSTVVLAMACAASVTACGSSSAPSRTAVPTPTPTCPTTTTAPVSWPRIVPTDLPKPPTAVMTGEQAQNNVVYLRFTTSTSLRDGLLFVLRELPKAGYTVGRGDAEVTEADVPFTGPTILAAMRLTSNGRCSTSWTLAVARRSAPTANVLQPNALIPHTTPASASPLPFG